MPETGKQMTDHAHILVVDDDERLCRLLCRYLDKNGFRASSVPDGKSMFRLLETDIPDLVVLDLMLPGDDGFSLARQLRDRFNLGIIILTGKPETTEKIIGLEIGADDYMTKPFEERELLARIRSVLRRMAGPADQPGRDGATIARFAGWALDLTTQDLTAPDGRVVPLTSYEFQLLSLFVQHPNRVFSRQQIMNHIAHRDWEPSSRSVDILVGKLRRKLGEHADTPSVIKTIRNEGYKFATRVTHV